MIPLGFQCRRLCVSGMTVLHSASLAQDLPATLHLTTAGHEVLVFFARELPRHLPCGSAGALVPIVLGWSRQRRLGFES